MAARKRVANEMIEEMNRRIEKKTKQNLLREDLDKSTELMIKLRTKQAEEDRLFDLKILQEQKDKAVSQLLQSSANNVSIVSVHQCNFFFLNGFRIARPHTRRSRDVFVLRKRKRPIACVAFKREPTTNRPSGMPCVPGVLWKKMSATGDARNSPRLRRPKRLRRR